MEPTNDSAMSPADIRGRAFLASVVPLAVRVVCGYAVGPGLTPSTATIQILLVGCSPRVAGANHEANLAANRRDRRG